MFIRKRKPTTLYLSLIIAGLFALTITIAAQPALADVLPHNAYQQLQAAWQRAGASKQYQYHSTVLQTTTPAATLTNAGRSLQTQRVHINGKLDKAADTMQMQMQVGQQPPLAVKVEDGQSYGRQGSNGAWFALESTPEIFVPGGDPLGFLVAVEDVRQLSLHEDGMDDFSTPAALLNAARGENNAAITRYAFTLSGPRFARFMKEQMEAELRRNGELPPSLSLRTPTRYLEMTGHGEIWLNADGLPMRQLLHVEFPNPSAAAAIAADISTSFDGWRVTGDPLWTQIWRDPSLLFSQPATVTGISPQTAQTAGLSLGITLFILGLAALALTYRRRWAVRATVYGLIIVSMVVTPLLQTQQVSAFYDGQQARTAETPPAAVDATAAEATFDPHANPVQVAMANTAEQLVGESAAPEAAPAAILATTNSANAAQVAATCTITETSQCDEDGLIDQVEIHQLGTFVDDVDTDNDSISDNMEVQGFSVGGQSWYLDPRSPDSNGDGLLDTLECIARVNVDKDGALDASVNATACPDTDGDGVPDVYDFDNDGDGVPDGVDGSPFSAQAVTDSAFGLALAGYQSGKALDVTFQIRPADDRHLWWTNTYLDWPDNDKAGQVQRVTDESITSGVDADMQLSPVLEIALPYNGDNPSRGLPVLDGVDAASIGKTTPTTEWLDRTAMAPYAITVGEVNADDGALFAYLPLTTLEDSVGDSPVALTGVMHYEMASAASDWGDDQQVKLLWLVNGLNDDCTVPDGLSDDEAKTYCDDDANWISEQTLLTSYYDDFMVTSLSVTESHGGSAAVFAEQSASGAYEANLWHLADVLQRTFLTRATDPNTGQRLTVGNIDNHLSPWGVGGLYVNEILDVADDVTLQAALTGAEITAMLDSARSSPAVDERAHLLFAVENSTRSVSLGETGSSFGNSTFTLDLSDSAVATRGKLRWQPYIYTAGGWTLATVASTNESDTVLDALDTELDSVFSDSVLAALLDDAVSDYSSVRAGAKQLAVNTYLSHYAGTSVSIGAASYAGGALFSDSDYVKPSVPAAATVARLLAVIQRYYAHISLSNLDIATSDAEIDAVGNTIWADLATSTGAVLTGIGDTVIGDASSLAVAMQELDSWADPSDVAGLTDSNTVANTSTITRLSKSGSDAKSFAGRTKTLKDTWEQGRKLQQAMNDVKELRNAQEINLVAGAGKTELQAAQEIVDELAPKFADKFGLVTQVGTIALYFAWTLASSDIALDSTDFDVLLAHSIAQVVVAVVEFAIIASNPGTAIIFAALHVLDALIALGCDIADVGADRKEGFVYYACKGFSGVFEHLLALAINDATYVMDIQNENGLETAFATSVTSAGVASGLAVNNTLGLSTVITANAYAGHPNWMGYIYEWQLSDDNVKESAVDFRLQQSADDFEESLSLGDTAWERPDSYETQDLNPQPGVRFTKDFTRATDVILDAAGVNLGLDEVYFSQAVKVRKQDCWAIPNPGILPPLIPICQTEEVYDDTFHQSMGDSFIMDVFPATLDDFHALAQNVDGEPGMRLAWDEAFPVLADADGDGLVSKALNGPDPDDSNPDSDADGLSDFYEIQNGFDATEADADCDGLTDYWEAFYGTDPEHGDSDHDGVLDSQEVFHPNIRYPYKNSSLSNTTVPTCASDAGLTSGYDGGWDIIYTYDGDTPLHFWTSADPNDPDSDDDGLTDRQEQVYGYNPHAPSELDVLALDTSWTSEHPQYNPYLRATSVAGYGYLDYAATVTNDLNNKYLRGLLETEFPVDSIISTREVGTLLPQASSTLTGTVAIEDIGITASTATSLTLRAGAIVDKLDDHLFWLRMNQPAGTDVDTFADSTVYDYDIYAGNMTATGQFAYFPVYNSSLNISLTSALRTTLDEAEGLTFALWFKLTESNNGWNTFLLTGSSTGNLLWVNTDGYLRARGNLTSSTLVTADEWHHAAVTFDGATTRLYLDGQLEASGGDGKTTFSTDIAIGAGYHSINATYAPFYMDDLEVFTSALSDEVILNSYGRAAVAADLTSTGDGVSCSGSRCPSLDDDGATFDQTQHLVLDTSTLNFSENQFSIAVNVTPQTRSHPFGSSAASYFGMDTSQDWQGVYGYTSPSNSKLIFPSLYVGSNGALRVVIGDGNDACTYTTNDKIVTFGVEQEILVSFDGSAFTFYINGEERASGTSTACGSIQIPAADQLYVGRPNANGYLYFDKATFTNLTDGVLNPHGEVRINFNDDGSSGNIWNADVDIVGSDPGDTLDAAIGVGVAAWNEDSDSFRFRLWEDDGSSDDNDYNNSVDDNILEVTGITNISHVSTSSTPFDSTVGGEVAVGSLYWTLSNQFFVGTLRNLRIYDYAFSPAGAARVYNTETFALQIDMDEAPGANLFVDDSGNYFEATCIDDSCPDSGIPGRHNQALRFDGGVADDDGNDGVVDYLTMSTTAAGLGLQESSFTVMAWVKADNVSGTHYVLRTADNAVLRMGIKNGKAHFGLVTSEVNSSAAVAADEWVHLAWVYDKATSTKKIYINGILDPNSATHAAYGGDATIWIGHDFDGLLDDLRILTYAADAGTIARMMNEAPLVNLHLDEDLNTTSFANDSPNTNAATCTGDTCPGAGDKGQMRESASFDGVDDALTVSNSGDLDLETYTVALWVKPTQKKSLWQTLIYKGADGAAQRTFALLINPDAMTLRHNLQKSDCAAYATRDSTGSLLLNQWNHVVMTFDGNENALYINGSLDGAVAYVGTPCQSSNPVHLGASTASNHTPFAGNLDEVTVASGALSEAQVHALYDYQSAWYDEKQQHTILVDADYPTSALIAEGEYVEPGQVLFIDAEDPVVNGVASGLYYVNYRIDGGSWQDAVADDAAYFIPATVTAGWSAGSHTIDVRATDTMGHRATGETTTIQIDTTAPTVAGPCDEVITVTGACNSQADTVHIIKDATGSFSGAAFDDQGAIQSGLDVESVQITMRDHSGDVIYGPVAANVPSLGDRVWLYNHTFSIAPYGQYAFDVTAKDEAGNEGRDSSRTLWLDGLSGYGDMLTDASIITGTGTVISGLASDIPYPQSGRALHMHFEETTGATLFYDGSQNHLNATCTGSNCPTSGADGPQDGALSLDGSDYLTLSDQGGVSAAQVLNLDGSFTVMAWLYPNALSGTQWVLAAEQSASTGGIGFGLNGDKLLLRAFGAQDYVSTTAIAAGSWSHVAAKYNVTDNTATFYLNGEVLETVSGTAEPVTNVDDAYRIGEGFSGSLDELAVYSTNLSAEEIYDIANPVPNYSSLVHVRYRHASGTVWPGLDPDGLMLYLPLDEPVGSVTFEDLSTYGWEASCSDEQCPTAAQNDPAQSIETGTHLYFDGADDYLSMPPVLDPAATNFSASLWFKLNTLGETHTLLAQESTSGADGTWLIVNNSGQLYSFLGGILSHPTTVTPSQWHHTALTYDGTTLTLYLDGEPTSTAVSLDSLDGDLLLGTNRTSGNGAFWQGALDEVALFDRALTATEIGYLGASPWYDASPIYNSLNDGDVLGSSDKLRDWSHEVPEGLEGPYKIDLLVADGPVPIQRRSVSRAVWTGEIDTLAPRVELAYTLSADKSSVTISCAVADYNLSEEGWECPVDVANRSSHNKDAEWFTTVFSDTEKLAGYTTASEVFTPGFNLHVTACDMWGQCTTLAPEDTDGDLIPDTVEGQGDRDGDGILDAHDYDPDGHFYELGTGKLVPGSTISVSGPGAVSIDPDGDLGYYDWTTDGTPGLYVMTVTPPEGYVVSPDCPAEDGAITPSGDVPLFLGSSEVAATKTLADGSCAANPYYLQFNVAEGEPFVFNNNIPLAQSDPTALPPTDEPVQENKLFLPIIGKQAPITGSTSQLAPSATEPESEAQSQISTTAAERIFLPVVAKQ